MDSFFSGAYSGNRANLKADDRLECKICWYLYDPAEGDSYWQIPPGTPFAELPDHWSCPNCDSSKAGFLLVTETRDG